MGIVISNGYLSTQYSSTERAFFQAENRYLSGVERFFQDIAIVPEHAQSIRNGKEVRKS
jgi:hypothetical protein